MARKRYNEEDILRLLREIEVHLHGGMDVVSACRNAQCVFQLNTKVSHRTIHLGMAKQELNSAQVARLAVDQRRFGASQRMRLSPGMALPSEMVLSE